MASHAVPTSPVYLSSASVLERQRDVATGPVYLIPGGPHNRETGLPTSPVYVGTGAISRTSGEAVPGASRQVPVREERGLDRLFLGVVGDSVYRHGDNQLDGTTSYNFRARTTPIAPQGFGGECLFRNLYVVLESLSGGTMNVTPIVDGLKCETIQVTVDGENPEREVYEIPLTLPYEVADVEVSRRGVRGTWVQALIVAEDTERLGFGITIEGVEVEYEPVRETLPRTFTHWDRLLATRPVVEALFVGEVGDGIWSMDLGLGVGISSCLSGSSDGICKLVEGLRKGFDYTVGNDRFVFGDEDTQTAGWIVLSGTNPVDDPVNGYVELPATVRMYYYDPDLDETAEQMVMAEIWYESCSDVLPGVTLLMKDLDDDANWDHYYCMVTWIITCTNKRMVLGKRVGGSDSALSSVLVAGVENAFFWASAAVVPDVADNKVYGSDNDTNWDVGGPISVNRDSGNFGRVGRPGIRSWELGVYAGRTAARLRRWRWHRNTRIEMRKVPDNHQVVIERDSGQWGLGAKSATIQNTSGGEATVIFDNEGYPVSTPEKGIAPYHRIYVTTIAAPTVKLAELEEDVNWGSVYTFMDDTVTAPDATFSYVLEPNEVAPGGVGGECLFHSLYLVVTRDNDMREVECVVVPILDDVEYPSHTLTFAQLATAHPITEVCEVPLHRPYAPQGPEDSRFGTRGTWFRFRIESDSYEDDGSVLIFEGAEIDYTILRESKDAQTTVVAAPDSGLEPATPPPAVPDERDLESGDARLLESGDTRLLE